MAQTLPWTPWHEVVKLRDDVRTGELSLADFAADLYDVAMQKGERPAYEDANQFFALTYPTVPLRDLARDVALRLAGENAKAIRQLELTYGGGKTHTLITLYHLMSDPESLPALPAVEQFRSHIGAPLPTARVAALCFDKLDVEKGMEVRGPEGEVRWLKFPWSVLAFQLAGEDGLRTLHPAGANEERETPPAEPLVVDVLKRPQEQGLGTLVLIDEVLMYAREKAAMEESWSARLPNFFQYLCQATTKVDRCALVASLLASDPAAGDTFGKQLTQEISKIFDRQQEGRVQPVEKQDVAELLRRRFFDLLSIADTDIFRPHVISAVANIAEIDEAVRKNRVVEERRFLDSYPFHPGLTDIFYTKWTQMGGFQRTRGILRTFAVALRDSERFDSAPLVGPNVFLSAPGEDGLAEAARELTGTATHAITEAGGNDWGAVLEGEIAKAKSIQKENSALRFREMEQAVFAVFLSSQPIGQKSLTPELMALVGSTRPDRIEIEKSLRRWTELSWFLDEAEFAGTAKGNSDTVMLPEAWRLGNQPNLKQMHHDACVNRVTESQVEQELMAKVREARNLTLGAKDSGACVHMLPESPRDIKDDWDFHFAILGPSAASQPGEASKTAQRFIDETTGEKRPRNCRNAVVLAVPSYDGLAAARQRIREYLGWKDVRNQLKDANLDSIRDAMLSDWTETARKCVPDAICQAWEIVVAVNSKNVIEAFKVTVGEDALFTTIKGNKQARIKDSPISAEAMLPGGPYDLWSEDDASRRVWHLAGAFAEKPKLPKMLRRQAILDTIKQGVLDGVFVASLRRPDNSFKTWWRTRIDESTWLEKRLKQLELFLPEKASLEELDHSVLAPGVLPELWSDEAIAVGDVVKYFESAHTVILQHDGYTEPVGIPACARKSVELAVSEAVLQGDLCLVNGSVSYQGEEMPIGMLSDSAELRPPLTPLSGDQLTADALPEAWKNGRANVRDLRSALSEQIGVPLPWPILQQSIDSALSSRWLECAAESGLWPCESSHADSVILRVPEGGGGGHRGVYFCSGELDPSELQDLSDTLPKVIRVTAGVPLCLRLDITLGDGNRLDREKVNSVNRLLENVNSDLYLKWRKK